LAGGGQGHWGSSDEACLTHRPSLSPIGHHCIFDLRFLNYRVGGEHTMKCHKCGGIMSYEKFYDKYDDYFGWRCIACGEIIDQVILDNRLKQKH